MNKRISIFLGMIILVACQSISTPEPTSTPFSPITVGTPIPPIFEPITNENAHLITQLAYWETEYFTDDVVNFSLDSQYLLVGRHGRLTSKFDISTGTMVSEGIGDDDPGLYPSDIRNDRSSDGLLAVFEYYVAGITVGEFIVKNTSALNRVFVEIEYTALNLFPNGEYLVIVLEGKKVKIIPIDSFGTSLFGIDSEYPTSEKISIDDARVTFEAQKQVSSVITTPDNNFIIIVYEDNTIQRVDVSTLTVINEFKLKDLPNTRRFLPGSSIIAFGFPDQTIELWNVNSGGKLTVLEGHSGRIRDLAFSPDGRFFASLNNESNVFLWGILSAPVP